MARASKEAAAALRFLPKLVVPEGRLAGKRLKLATYQKQFVGGAFAKETKTALSAGLSNAGLAPHQIAQSLILTGAGLLAAALGPKGAGHDLNAVADALGGWLRQIASTEDRSRN